MPFHVSSVSASTVDTNCFISSLAGGLVSAHRAAAARARRALSSPESICSGSMPQARSPKIQDDEDDDRAQADTAAAAAHRNADWRTTAACGRNRRENRRRPGRARPRHCHSDDGLSKAFSFLSGYRPGGKPRRSAKVNGKIAEWFCQVIGFFADASVSRSRSGVAAASQAMLRCPSDQLWLCQAPPGGDR